jgi:hypothetical protein
MRNFNIPSDRNLYNEIDQTYINESEIKNFRE